MNRRRFFTVSAVTAASLAGSGCRIEKVQRVRRPIENLRLAGRTLEELREQYRYDLFDDFLPFMDKYVVDHNQGGFVCGVDRDGSRVSTDKRTVTDGCGLWVYAYLYNAVSQENGFRETARKSLLFLRKNKPVGDDLWPERFTTDGRVIGKPDQRGYSDIYAALGLQEYARASGETKWWDTAKEILLKVVRLHDRPDYSPTSGQEYLGPKAPLTPGARVQGIWMGIITLASRMLDQKQDPEIGEILSRSIGAVLNFHYHPEYGLNNELLNHDMSRPANEYSQLVSIGNSLETLRTLLFEAVRTRNRKLYDDSAARFRHHAESAWDPIYGGVYQTLFNVTQNEWDLTKSLRVQEEVLTGSLCIIENTGEQWARDLFEKTYLYVRDRFPLKRYGYPLWMSGGDRRVTFEPHANSVDIFYHPRHLMFNILALDRMLKRGGKVSNLFG